MSTAKGLITGFLLLTSILAAAQMVHSQQYATTTLTTLLTSNQPSTEAVGTQVVTTTAGQTTPVFTGPVTIPGTHGVCGIYFVQAFNGTAGEVFVGSVNASSAVDVYVMTGAVFQSWEHQVVAGGNCTPSSLVANQKSTTAAALTAPLPASGTYDLVVNNLSETTVTAQINANLATSAPTPATSVIYSTVTQQMVQTLMQTSLQTLQTSMSGSGGLDMTTLAGVVVVIIIIAAVAYLAKTKRGKPEKK